MGCTPRRWTFRCDEDRGDRLCGGMHTEETDLAVCCTPRRQLCDRISRRNRNQSEKTLACLSGGSQMGSNHEKVEGRTFRDTLPLRMLFLGFRVPMFLAWTQRGRNGYHVIRGLVRLIDFFLSIYDEKLDPVTRVAAFLKFPETRKFNFAKFWGTSWK